MDLRTHRRHQIPMNHNIGSDELVREHNSDPLFDRDWEVFVVRHDVATGTLVTTTACCDDALDQR